MHSFFCPLNFHTVSPLPVLYFYFTSIFLLYLNIFYLSSKVIFRTGDLLAMVVLLFGIVVTSIKGPKCWPTLDMMSWLYNPEMMKCLMIWYFDMLITLSEVYSKFIIKCTILNICSENRTPDLGGGMFPQLRHTTPYKASPW